MLVSILLTQGFTARAQVVQCKEVFPTINKLSQGVLSISQKLIFTEDLLEIRPYDSAKDKRSDVEALFMEPSLIDHLKAGLTPDANSFIRLSEAGTFLWPDQDYIVYTSFVIFHKIEQKIIGVFSLVDHKNLEKMEIGYALLPLYRGHHYAERAARAVIQGIEAVHGPQEFYGFVHTGNHASSKTLKRLGFKVWLSEEDGDFYKSGD